MIPTLYEKNEFVFLTKGICFLPDAISCVVTEERNGIFVLVMTYPVEGGNYKELLNDRIILAKPNETMQDQPFRIYSITAPINGVVTVSTEHISYQLNNIPVFPFTATNCPAAVSGMVSNSVMANPFIFSTDKSTQGQFAIKEPVNFRSRLHSVQGSLVDVYGGGDYLFDRWSVQLLAKRGRNNGVSIEYGKNLTDLKQEMSIASLVTGVAPYWANGEGELVTLPEKVIKVQNEYSFDRTITKDFSQEFKEKPTVQQLREATNTYLAKTDLKTPKISLTVSFIPLWQAENYKENPLYEQVAGLERVSMGDTVRVRFVKLGVDASARVTKTVYDVITERYESVSIGEPSSSAVDRTVGQQVAINEAPTTSMMEQAIIAATNAITGATNGYVVSDPPKNPQRILIMDKPNKDEAVRVWQWNLNGLGYSKNGINGPYETAITMNGQIVANFITTGTLNANLVNVTNLNADNIVAGTLQSSNNKTKLNLATGLLTFDNGDGNQLNLDAVNGLRMYVGSALVTWLNTYVDLQGKTQCRLRMSDTTGNITAELNSFGVIGKKYFLRKDDGSVGIFAIENNGSVMLNPDSIFVYKQGDNRGLWVDGYRVMWRVNSDGEAYLGRE